MKKTHLRSRSSVGFTTTPLHRKREPHAIHYLSQRLTFWIAALSLIAFVTGNMMGQHGWYAFWASVLGKEAEMIVFDGTVPPIEHIPDYDRWAALGGDSHQHTFQQVPQDLLIPFPQYDARLGVESFVSLSTDHGGTYAGGRLKKGSHNGVDIRTPVGTPVRAVANGRVIAVQSEDHGGFGKYVSIEHPNVPDPLHPGETTTLVSSYSHLSTIFVTVGEVVSRGQGIALSGNTGTSTGPHLQFQVDRGEAQWFPYWAFTEHEARNAGLNPIQAVNSGLFRSRLNIYTVHPLLFVQNNDNPSLYIVRGSTESEVREEVKSAAPTISYRDLVARRRSQRLEDARIRQRARIARRRFSERSVSSVASATPIRRRSPIVHQETVVSILDDSVEPASFTAPLVRSATNVSAIAIEHDGSFTGRGWEKVEITLLDEKGRPVVDPHLERPLDLRTAFGRAEFRPSSLTAKSFINGVLTVQMLPRGRRTVVIQVQPYGTLSRPMRYER